MPEMSALMWHSTLCSSTGRLLRFHPELMYSWTKGSQHHHTVLASKVRDTVYWPEQSEIQCTGRSSQGYSVLGRAVRDTVYRPEQSLIQCTGRGSLGYNVLARAVRDTVYWQEQSGIQCTGRIVPVCMCHK